MFAERLALAHTVLRQSLGDAVEEAELAERVFDGLWGMGMHGAQVHDLLLAAVRKGWCRRLPLRHLPAKLFSNLYYRNPYHAVKWLEANTDWIILQTDKSADLLGLPADLLRECQAGNSVYAIYGGQLAVVEPGLLVGEIYERCAASLSLPATWAAHVGDEDVFKDYRTKAGDVIEFCEDHKLAFESDPPNRLKKQKPEWHPARRELWFRGKLIKRFLQKAPNQEAVITEFDKEGWRRGIDNPLPLKVRMNPKSLSDTVFGLNQNHVNEGLIQFESDGTGRVLWKDLVREH